jgi:hypothetical protein
MNQKIIDFTKKFTSFIFSFAFLIGIIFLIWKVSIFGLDRISLFFKYIEDLYKNGTLPLPLIILACTTFATITTAIITTLITKSNSLNLQIRAEQREKKALVYEELTGFFFKRIFASKTNSDENLLSKEDIEKEIIGFLTSYTPKIIMWGSDEVLREFYLFRDISLKVESDPDKVFDVIRKFEEVLFSIRRDLGHKNKGLKEGNILGLFVNDVEKLLVK